MKNLAVLLAVISAVLGEKLPSSFPICKGASNFNDCMKNAIDVALPNMANGLPDLGVPPIQPLNIPSVTIGEGKGPVNVVQNYRDFNLYGLSESKVQKIDASVSPTELKINVEVFIPETRFEADYDFNGRVLLLPIVGKGRCQVTLSELKTNVKIYASSFEKKGKKYLRVKDFSVDLIPGKVEYRFDNLFNGDERLGTEMNKVLNENWKEVFEDVKVGYNKVLETVFLDYANRIFTKVPYEEMF